MHRAPTGKMLQEKSASVRFFLFKCSLGLSKGVDGWFHAPVSPTLKAKSSGGSSPSLSLCVCRTFHACRRVCVSRVSVRRALRSTDGSEPGEGAVSAGYLVPSANPSAPASGGAASKPGADSSKERMWFINRMISGNLEFNANHSTWLNLESFISVWSFFKNRS